MKNKKGILGHDTGIKEDESNWYERFLTQRYGVRFNLLVNILL